MKSLLRRNIFFLSSSSPGALQARELSSSPHQWSRCGEEEESSRNVRVSVWWDFKNCHVPEGYDASKVAFAIMQAVRTNGIKGPLNITAFGNVHQLSQSNQEALVYTGIRLSHVSNDGRNSADILVDLMYWVSQNPPPAHLFFISGDRDFAGILHRLRMNNYNILLATPTKPPSVLCTAATIAWQWSSLLKGEDLAGKHFNPPPDGLIGSWYGSYKAPLAKPLTDVEIYEPSLEVKLGLIPSSVARQVRHILSSHPKGICITDLHVKLAKCDVRLDKNFYGYKKFSHFLSSIPLVQLQPLGDGDFNVHLVPSESPKPFESRVVPSTMAVVKNEERGYAATPKLNGDDKNKAKDVDETSSIASFHERSLDDDLKSFQSVSSQGKPDEEFMDVKSSFPSFVDRHFVQTPNVLQKSSVASDNIVDVGNAQQSEIQLFPKDNKDFKTRTGSVEMTSQNTFDDDIVKSEGVSHKILENNATSGNHSSGNNYSMVENDAIAECESENLKAESKCESSTRNEVGGVCHSLYSSPTEESLVDKRPGGSVETYSRSPIFFSCIRSRWPFWKSNAKYDDSAAHQSKVTSHVENSKVSELDQTVSHFEDRKVSELDQNASCSGKPKLFSSVSFWNDVESFVFTPKGSLLFSQSRSREDMAHKLQNDGPLALRSLLKKDILQLVELLIAEKKWLEESPSQTFPFRLTQPLQKNSMVGQSHGSNGLSSLFLSRTSQSNLQKPLKHHVEKQNQSISHTRVSAPATETKYAKRSRNDILEDCQKLVSEILRKHPEGYNIGSFRRHFADRYGYHLDIQELGFQKLASLLQIMPGVKLELTYIFPFVPAVSVSDLETLASNSDSALSESPMKDDNMESPREELVPISVNHSNPSDLEDKLLEKAIELDLSKHPDYEPVVLDDDTSDSEGDSSCLTQPEEQEKTKCDEEDNYFWQAKDLWHSSKGREISVKQSDNVNVLYTSLADILNSSSASTKGTLSKTPSSNYREKQKSQKNYSFVDDPVLPNKDKLINGILDGNKKADESKM
ncbi:uncharacterized protein LOC113850572 [Abrus precatorius]|uniref:Uncharacterized protein LOC113850572 n=1 Tax=Abrus precatorius TaxID=3816 RepID=A0A8B8JZR7_ABRPR|nr:uncharacterized protein LOC113850572 [Abrus precatorius]